MSLWRADPERAAEALITGCLERIDLGHRVLLVEPGQGLVAALRSRSTTVWRRRAGHGDAATPDPRPGPSDAALIRLPKSKPELEMIAHQVAAVTVGPIFVYGGNDEGIRSAAKRLSSLRGVCETVAAEGHGRVLRLKPDPERTQRPYARDWRQVRALSLPGDSERSWITYPGLFAGGALDDGTALLLTVLTRQPICGGRVLDYGCGTGVIARALIDAAPDTRCEMMDADAIALLAAAENVPEAMIHLGARLADLPAGTRFGLIVSNPPIHDGIEESHGTLHALIEQAPGVLDEDGALILVVQRRVALDRVLTCQFASVEVIADDGRYRVWRGASVRQAP